MKRIALLTLAGALLAASAVPAQADEAMTAREIQAAVDSYVQSADQDVNFVGGPGTAGYDAGFWIRGGDFSLRINATIQARYEYFRFDAAEANPQVPGVGGPAAVAPGGGQTQSGFSVPRAIVKFSGTAPCNMRYYIELDFGHWGEDAFGDSNLARIGAGGGPPPSGQVPGGPPFRNVFPWSRLQRGNFANSREAWIEWGCSDSFNFRVGQIKIPTTRQLMVPPELQQFVDISMASAVTGVYLPGYTDRPRDFGAMIHGVFGCDNEWSYQLAVTNGDGADSLRNVLDSRTSDQVAFSGRLNWVFLDPIGYQEGATRQNTCSWYGEIGLWGFYYTDRQDAPGSIGDRLSAGADLALGYGGFSSTFAFTYQTLRNSQAGLVDEEWLIALVQLGYHFPDTAWEIAARWSWYTRQLTGVAAEPQTSEIALGINYYLNGHSNKIQLDFSYISPNDAPNFGGYYDVYAGVPVGFGSANPSWLVRLQWQLAL
jgi:hypothetical protein